MRLAFNTGGDAVAKWPIDKALRTARRLGCRYAEYAALDPGDPP